MDPDDVFPEAADLQIRQTVWQRICGWLPEAEQPEVYRLIGPADIDDSEALYTELDSLVVILRDYRQENDELVRSRRSATEKFGGLHKVPAKELITRQLRPLVEKLCEQQQQPNAPPLPAPQRVIDYVLCPDHAGAPQRQRRRPPTAGSSGGSRRPQSQGGASTSCDGVASPNTRPTSTMSMVSGDSDIDLAADVFPGGLDHFRARVSAESVGGVAAEIRALLHVEQGSLREDIAWLHELLQDEMGYNTNAQRFGEPSLAELTKLKETLDLDAERARWGERLRSLPDASRKRCLGFPAPGAPATPPAELLPAPRPPPLQPRASSHPLLSRARAGGPVVLEARADPTAVGYGSGSPMVCVAEALRPSPPKKAGLSGRSPPPRRSGVVHLSPEQLDGSPPAHPDGPPPPQLDLSTPSLAVSDGFGSPQAGDTAGVEQGAEDACGGGSAMQRLDAEERAEAADKAKRAEEARDWLAMAAALDDAGGGAVALEALARQQQRAGPRKTPHDAFDLGLDTDSD
eukprot:TRINITY_DN1148_c0_g1_i1.p1 TRINITY_DN1148_c0_g1~~TRINITY_DN1148_c0_g1_i1.p1  ORF type:complete len:531 (+),score=173.24 TRINITY_DN1148_c0_g1_i1:44-1594(+)